MSLLPAYTGKDRAVVSIGSAALLWIIWKTRNKYCFQSVLPTDPTNVIFILCSLLESWVVLQKRGLQGLLSEVSKRLSPWWALSVTDFHEVLQVMQYPYYSLRSEM